MSFWKSAEHKARKKRRCELCYKAIQVGEKYSRQTGVAEGEFHDYCLCMRCDWLLQQYPEQEYLIDIWHLLNTYDYISCPACNAYSYTIKEVKPNKEELTVVCKECKEEWEEDISIDGLKRIAARW